MVRRAQRDQFYSDGRARKSIRKDEASGVAWGSYMFMADGRKYHVGRKTREK